MKFFKYLTLSLGLLASVSAFALKELNVAYFLEWPSANQVAQLEKTYDQRMGLTVNWKPFDNGNQMVQAIASGDIDIAYSNGFVPQVLGYTKGVKIKVVGVAMTYAENDNCVVHKDAGITKKNAKKLEGKKVASPIGNVTHFKLLKTLKHLGVDADKVKIVPSTNADASSALARGDVAMACGFGGSLVRMKQYGKVLMTGAEQEAIGLKVFDVVTVSSKFLKKNRKAVTQFMQVTEDANLAYNRYPDRFYKTLAKASGMKRAGAVDTLKKFTFLTRGEQLSNQWMLGGIQKFAKQVADFYVEQGEIPKALSRAKYKRMVDASILGDVK